MSRRAKELRSLKKTREWLESLGYTVEKCERSRIVRRELPDGTIVQIPRTSDLWGADLLARNVRELLFVQVKSNPVHMAKGARALEVGPWPTCRCVRRIVVLWPPRRKVSAGPEVREAGV